MSLYLFSDLSFYETRLRGPLSFINKHVRAQQFETRPPLDRAWQIGSASGHTSYYQSAVSFRRLEYGWPTNNDHRREFLWRTSSHLWKLLGLECRGNENLKKNTQGSTRVVSKRNWTIFCIFYKNQTPWLSFIQTWIENFSPALRNLNYIS